MKKSLGKVSDPKFPDATVLLVIDKKNYRIENKYNSNFGWVCISVSMSFDTLHTHTHTYI